MATDSESQTPALLGTDSPSPQQSKPGVTAAGLRTNCNPYLQVALTYLRRPFSSPGSAMMTATVGLSLGGGIAFLIWDRDHSQHHSPWLVMMLSLWFMGLTTRVAEQFASPRAHLMPAFRRFHVAVAAAVAVVAAVLLPTSITWLAGLHSVGLVALTAFMFGVILWAKSLSSLHGTVQILLLVFGTMALASEPLTGFLHLDPLIHGQYEPMAFGLLTVGVALALLGGIRLVQLDEDTPAYHWILLARDWSGRNPQTMRDMAEMWADHPRMQRAMQKRSPREERHIARLIGHVRRAGISPWSRVCRWQGLALGGWMMVSWCLMTVFVAQLSVWFLPNPDVSMSVVMWTTMPALVGLGALVQVRTQALTYELCLPVDRVTYIRQLFAGAAIGQLQFWGSTSITLVLWRLMTTRQPSEMVPLGVALLISACLQIPVFGIFVWTAQRRTSPFRWMVAAIAMVGVSIGLASIAVDVAKDFLPGVMVAAPIFAAFGLLLVWHAYRRWLVVDVE